MALANLLDQYVTAHFTSVKNLLLRASGHDPSVHPSSDVEYQPLSTDAVAPEPEVHPATEAETETETLQVSDDGDMGFQDQFEKPEGRSGDAIAQILAVVSIIILSMWCPGLKGYCTPGVSCCANSVLSCSG